MSGDSPRSTATDTKPPPAPPLDRSQKLTVPSRLPLTAHPALVNPPPCVDDGNDASATMSPVCPESRALT
jgi:hypothetical protein